MIHSLKTITLIHCNALHAFYPRQRIHKLTANPALRDNRKHGIFSKVRVIRYSLPDNYPMFGYSGRHCSQKTFACSIVRQDYNYAKTEIWRNIPEERDCPDIAEYLHKPGIAQDSLAGGIDHPPVHPDLICNLGVGYFNIP